MNQVFRDRLRKCIWGGGKRVLLVLSILSFCSCGRGGRRSGIHNRLSMHRSRIVHGSVEW